VTIITGSSVVKNGKLCYGLSIMTSKSIERRDALGTLGRVMADQTAGGILIDWAGKNPELALELARLDQVAQASKPPAERPERHPNHLLLRIGLGAAALSAVVVPLLGVAKASAMIDAHSARSTHAVVLQESQQHEQLAAASPTGSPVQVVGTPHSPAAARQAQTRAEAFGTVSDTLEATETVALGVGGMALAAAVAQGTVAAYRRRRESLKSAVSRVGGAIAHAARATVAAVAGPVDSAYIQSLSASTTESSPVESMVPADAHPLTRELQRPAPMPDEPDMPGFLAAVYA
jgi:hypothetical protein